MTDTPKDASREDPEAFKQTVARARAAFAKIPAVVSVGVGQKEVAGSYRKDIAIVVVVAKKRPNDQLAPAERIPPLFEGFPTDVVEVQAGTLLGCDNITNYPTIQGGIQIMATARTNHYIAGTLGCIVRRRGDPGRENVHLVTCKHVLIANGGRDNDKVYHPFTPPAPFSNASAPGPTNALGPILPGSIFDNVTYRPPGAPADITVFIDCGIARIDIDSKCFDSTCTKDVIEYATTIVDLGLGAGMIADVRSVIDDASIIGQPVYKVGRTSGRTAGIVRLLADARNVEHPEHPGQIFHAVTLIKIDFDPASTTTHVNCKGNERFSEVGDSGSIVVDAQGRAIGMIAIGGGAAADDALPPPRKQGSWACHILPVLDRLGVCIPTSGGTGHGSSGALDGSGIAGGVDFEVNDDGTLFASAAVLGVAAQPPPLPAAPPLTDAQRDRLLAFRDRLRQTALGRALHETFAEVRREIGYLVRNSRPVKVAWHRAEGPAFFAHMLKHLRGDQPSVPLAIAGVARAQFLERVGAALGNHGSNPLREALERYGPVLLPVLSTASTVDECLDRLDRGGDA